MALDLSRMRRADAQGRRPWHGGAFVVESLVLLAFLVAALAVTIQLMGVSHERGTQADRMSNAIILASNDAEAFAANPQAGNVSANFQNADGALRETGEGDDASGTAYQVSRTVSQQSEAAGTLYQAHIAVTADGETVYELDTARYVSSEGVAR